MSEIEKQLGLFVERQCVPGRMPFREFSRAFFAITLMPHGDSIMVRDSLARALKKRGLLNAVGFDVALAVK